MNKYILVFIAVLYLSVSCGKDFFDVDNKGVAGQEEVNNVDPVKSLNAFKTGLYAYIFKSGSTGIVGTGEFGFMSFLHLGDVMNDDMALNARAAGFSLDHELVYWGQTLTKPAGYWFFFYTLVQKANNIIDLADLESEDIEIKSVVGQAYAIRAMSNFYLAQMFQQTYIGNENTLGVLLIKSEKEGKTIRTRATLETVYEQISADFEKSLTYLEGWTRPESLKYQINENVAAGLYSRVCLVMNRWEDAIKYAQIARDGKETLTQSELLAEGFNKITSSEWMWGSDITSETKSNYNSFFSFICSYDAGYGGDVGSYRKIDKRLYSYMSQTDIRRSQFKVTGSGYVYSTKEKTFPDYSNIKFKKVDFWEADYIYMRVAEFILTEAEALAHLGRGTDAAIVLKDLMKNRDPSWNATTVTVDDVYTQRRLELWGEGVSLFDHFRLKKNIDRGYSGNNHISNARYTIKHNSWYVRYQVPLSEFDNNHELNLNTDQNPNPDETEGTKFQNLND